MPPKTLQTPEEVQLENDTANRIIFNPVKRETYAARNRRVNGIIDSITEPFRVIKWPYIVSRNKIHPPV